MSLKLLPDKTQAVPRDGLTRPLVVPKRGGQGYAYTRTSTFADAIEDKSNLADWKLRMAVAGIAKRPDLLGGVNEVDPKSDDGKKLLNEIAATAIDLAGAHEAADKGTVLHSFTERVDAGDASLPGATEQDRADIMAYMLETIDFKMLHAEGFVVCDRLTSAGSFDRILHYEGPGPDGLPFDDDVIGDLKTGRIDYGSIKFAVQLAIYAHSEWYDWSRFPIDGYDPNDSVKERGKAIAKWKKVEHEYKDAKLARKPLGVNQDWGVLIHLPVGQARADLYWVDLKVGWKLALLAEKIRKARKTKGTLLPFAAGVSELSA